MMAAEPLITFAPGIDAWSLAPAIRSAGDGIDLALGISRGQEQSALTLTMSRDEARAFAFGVFAATGDGEQRTFAPSVLQRAAQGTVPAPQPVEQRTAASAQGFTGDVCPDCKGVRMRRSGTCLTCQDCGANTGCS